LIVSVVRLIGFVRMENNNQDESKQPKKKSHKKKMQTIKETQAELKKEKVKSAPARLPAKDKDKVAKYRID
jgi:hypothetical protein